MITFNDLAHNTSGKILQHVDDLPVKELIIDSRKNMPDVHTVFIAIPGQHHDGHQFLFELHKKGVRQFIVEKDVDLNQLSDSNVLKVENSIDALQSIAAYKRSLFSLEVIGITGSNGKTIVKEWLSHLLESSFYLIKNPKSYNSQIGVPLSVWKIEKHHQLGIFEAGISMPGEMKKLESIIKPKIGIFTNIGPAHNAGFDSLDQKIREKSRLFDHADLIVYCKDHQAIDLVMKEMPKMLLTWGANEESIIRIKETRITDTSTHISLIYKGRELNLVIPFNDKASLENLMHCISLMLFKGFEEEFIQQHLRTLSRMSMRLEIKKGISGCYLIDDSYSNDLSSLEVALEFMNQQPLKNKKTVILSDILQSGLSNEVLYKKIVEILKRNRITKVIGIGEGIASHQLLFEEFNAEFYSSTSYFLNHFDRNNFESELILIKGARSFGFEKIVRELQLKIHETVLEINLDALVNNLSFYRSQLKTGVKMMVMVKAVAYGSGSNEIAHLLQYHNVDYLGVAYTDEAVALRLNGIHLPIMVMNPSRQDFDKMVEYQLEPEIFDLDLLADFYGFLKLNEKQSKIHLKLDTGMHRLGFEQTEIDTLIKILEESRDYIQVASIFSHLAGADTTEHDDFTRKQASGFTAMTDKISTCLPEKPLYHLVNSAGILRFSDYQFDMVRLGIGLYGFESSKLSQQHLKAISTFKTNISQIKELQLGETIGYDRKGKTERKSRVATIAVGYADGFRRIFSNGVGSVAINGQRAPVIGNVCMDMTMIDVTDIEAEVGDDVIIFGEDPTISELAKKANTIPYEILTNVSERVKRVFYSE